MTSTFYFGLFLIFVLLGVVIEIKTVILPAMQRPRLRVTYKFTSKDGGLHWFDHRGRSMRASWLTDQLQDYHSAQGRK